MSKVSKWKAKVPILSKLKASKYHIVHKPLIFIDLGKNAKTAVDFRQDFLTKTFAE